MQHAEKATGFTDLAVGEACLLQKLLLPREPLRGARFEVTYLVRTYTEVGGDFLDYFLLDDGKLGIYMGDVVGKGLPAAIYAALAVGTLRSIKKTGKPPSAVLGQFNKCLRIRPVQSRYCASQYLVFDPETLKLHVANAGLPLPLHLSATGCAALGEGGLPSGLFDFAEYEEISFQLEPGDAVLIATDGLLEARPVSALRLPLHRTIYRRRPARRHVRHLAQSSFAGRARCRLAMHRLEWNQRVFFAFLLGNEAELKNAAPLDY